MGNWVPYGKGHIAFLEQVYSSFYKAGTRQLLFTALGFTVGGAEYIVEWGIYNLWYESNRSGDSGK
jgi:hypothetical protein